MSMTATSSREGMGALSIPSFTPFPTECLPELTARYVRQAARSIGCDETYIALPLLSALASAVGNTRVLELKPGWQEPCNIWAAIIGESGTHKTPAMKQVLSPVQARQLLEMEFYQQQFELYQSELADYEKQIKAWRASKNSECPAKPQEPVMHRKICQDITVEALAMILANNDRGVLVARDELSGWLSSFDAYKKQGSADVSQWLELFNGGTLTVDRKTGDPRTIHIPRASASITGGIQPGILTNLFGDKHFENGLAARFLFAMPPRKPKRWTDAGMSSNEQAVMDEIIDRLWALSFSNDNEPIVCELDASGKQAFMRFYNEHADEQDQLNGKLAAAWSKLEAYAARLALLLQLIKTAECGPVGPYSVSRIDGMTVANAVKLVRWFGAETLRIYHIMQESEDERLVRKTIEVLKRNNGELELRLLMRKGPCFEDRKTLDRVVGRLIQSGHGEIYRKQPDIQGGRPSDMLRLVHGGTVNQPYSTVYDGDAA